MFKKIFRPKVELLVELTAEYPATDLHVIE